jgi:hypothetical protein
MNNDDSIKNLLIQVSAITKKYESIAEITGENFNVFKVLGLTTNEVQTHSAFLTELLNPTGSHGCKDIFLKLLIDQMRLKFSEEQKSPDHQEFLNRFRNFNTENAKASVEHHIGIINDSWEEGGRIDIHIQDKENNVIIIENKIFAGDQKNQLVRYHNAYPGAPIFYLTLKGDKPTDVSKKGLNEGVNYACISYANDIIAWLEQCRKEAVSYPLLRETITQYIHLLKYLTNQTINEAMSEEIVKKIINNADFLEAILEIDKGNIINKIKKELALKFLLQVKEIADENDMILEPVEGFAYGHISDCNLKFKSAETDYFIRFGFNSDNYRDFAYGIYSDKKPYDEEHRRKIKEKLNNPGIVRPNHYDNWLWLAYIDNQFRTWDHVEALLSINDGTTLKTYFYNIVKLLQKSILDIDK